MDRRANFYLIKDLSRLSGHSVHTLKFYLTRGLIKESGRSPETRFRYFDDATLSQLSQIRTWRKQRKSLSEISRFLSGDVMSGGWQGGGPVSQPGGRVASQSVSGTLATPSGHGAPPAAGRARRRARAHASHAGAGEAVTRTDGEPGPAGRLNGPAERMSAAERMS